MGEPPIIWQHILVVCLSPLPAVFFGWLLNRRTKEISVRLNGQLDALRSRVEELEEEIENPRGG